MWANEDEFMKDLDVMGEIWEGMRVQSNAPIKKQENCEINDTNKRSVLFDDSEDEEDENQIDFEDESDIVKNPYELQRQIEKATGNVHSNRVITEYWQSTKNKQVATSLDNKEVEQNIVDKKPNSFIVQSSFDINKLKLVNNENKVTSKTETIVRKPKKNSVADAIQNSLKSKKPETNLPEATTIEENTLQRNIQNDSPVRKKEKIELPTLVSSPRKVLDTYKPAPKKSQPSNRFSLAIHNDGYKDYYTGQKLAEVEEVDDFNVRQNGDWDFSDYDWSSSSASYVSDRYGYGDDFFTKSNGSNKILNIKSDIDFPPLS